MEENQRRRHAAAVVRGGEVWGEAKKQLRLAAPLAAGFLLQKVIQTISIMFVGRLGELPLASASLATSFASVTGFSLLVSRQACISAF
jgi:MATE family multidrug resistance protein